MAKKTIIHYEDKSDQELEKAFVEKKEALRKFRFESSNAKITNVREAQSLKKEVARILTEMRKRELAANK